MIKTVVIFMAISLFFISNAFSINDNSKYGWGANDAKNLDDQLAKEKREIASIKESSESKQTEDENLNYRPKKPMIWK